MKKALAIIVICILAAIGIQTLYSKEIATLLTIEEIRPRNDDHADGAVYMMKVKGDFYLDELVAQGGVKSDEELVDFVEKKITKGLFPLNIDVPTIGCSCFSASTIEGDALFARNYDFEKANMCLVFTEANEGRHASVSSVDLRFIDINSDRGIRTPLDKWRALVAPYVPLDGLNDAGVSCSINMTYQGIGRTAVPTDQNTDKPDMNSVLLLRMILDYADDVEEAVEIAESYDMHESGNTSFHYMVADASGKSAILEWINEAGDILDNDGSKRQLIVTYNDQDEHIGPREAEADYQWMTNYIIHPNYYDSIHEMSGHDRYELIYEELDKTNGVVADEWGAMDILRQVGRRTFKPYYEGGTPHSVVYNLTDKSVLWVSNENFEDETAIFTFNLNEGLHK